MRKYYAGLMIGVMAAGLVLAGCTQATEEEVPSYFSEEGLDRDRKSVV